MSRRTDITPDASLRRWGEALRRNRLACRRLVLRANLTVLGCSALLVTTQLAPAPRLLWNASASAPIGLYWVSPGSDPDVSDMVVARPPEAVRVLAASRHYLPLGVPLVKRVAAGPGQQVCASGSVISIDGRPAVPRRKTDPRGRAMPWWSDCQWLHAHQYLLLMADAPASFDGRYFGVTNSSEIIGRARLLWRR